MEGNGSSVTWRELNLALTPLQTGLNEVDKKVDSIIETLAEKRGAELAKETFLTSSRFWITTAVLMFTGTIGSIVTIIFLKAG